MHCYRCPEMHLSAPELPLGGNPGTHRMPAVLPEHSQGKDRRQFASAMLYDHAFKTCRHA